MQEILAIFKEWPIIVQGAIGSALFWLILTSGGFLIRKSTELLIKTSKKKGIESLLNQRNIYDAIIGLKDSQTDAKDNTLRYQLNMAVLLASQILTFFLFVAKALIWFCLGVVVVTYISPIGVVGYIGGLFYLFLALNEVSVKGLKIDMSIGELERERRKVIDRLCMLEKTKKD